MQLCPRLSRDAVHENVHVVTSNAVVRKPRSQVDIARNVLLARGFRLRHCPAHRVSYVSKVWPGNAVSHSRNRTRKDPEGELGLV